MSPDKDLIDVVNRVSDEEAQEDSVKETNLPKLVRLVRLGDTEYRAHLGFGDAEVSNRQQCLLTSPEETVQQPKLLFERLKNFLKNIDPFTRRVEYPSLTGSILFFLVILPLGVIYTTLLFISYFDSTHDVACSVDVKWSAYSEPFPLRLKCMAISGCWASSAYSVQNNACIEQLSVDDQVCTYIEYEQTYTLQACYTNGLTSGPIVFWKSKDGEAGAATISDMLMPDNTIMLTPSEIEHGVFTQQYVQTDNYTASGSNRHRAEFFSNFATRVIDVENTSVCLSQLPGWSEDQLPELENGYPSQGNFSAGSMRIESSYNVLTCRRKLSLLRFLGELGGFLGLIFAVGRYLTRTIVITKKLEIPESIRRRTSIGM
ncbi:hypothetical protein CYMTET_35343 [Cymbomonas tetramitiformis]|uniref:Uncharacterized protein n=1 Tax=Cymbomonas tetramitiformis TaxID=36881 RepID=A0AAE0F9B5_9CHLO|nr:hypothetical protein CYMTET_35343 [Cymbomonas tetramitiformis]